jgi:hypothetical protein
MKKKPQAAKPRTLYDRDIYGKYEKANIDRSGRFFLDVRGGTTYDALVLIKWLQRYIAYVKKAKA